MQGQSQESVNRIPVPSINNTRYEMTGNNLTVNSMMQPNSRNRYNSMISMSNNFINNYVELEQNLNEMLAPPKRIPYNNQDLVDVSEYHIADGSEFLGRH